MTGGTDPADGPATGKPKPMRYWNQLAGAAAGIALLAGGVVAFMPRPPHHPPRAAGAITADCGLVQCSATLPATSTPGAAPRKAASPPPTRLAAANRHSQRPSRSPSPAPSRTQPPAYHGPSVTVGYAVVQSQNGGWGDRFTGRFTLVNHTGSAVKGWTLQVGLPGDRIEWVSTSPSGQPQYPGFSPVHDGVVISGNGTHEAIGAHGSMVVYLSAWGPSTSPASCSFNGSSC